MGRQKTSVKKDNINSLKLRIKELEKELNELKQLAGQSPDAEERKDSTDLSGLLMITLDLLEMADKSRVLQKIIQGAVQLFGLDAGALYVLKGDELIIESAIPELSESFPDEFRKAKLKDHPHILKALSTRSSVLIDNISKEQLSDAERLIVTGRNIRSLLYVPLFAMQQARGVMIIGTIDRTYKFSKREIELCHTISVIGSLSLENSLLFDQLNRNIDELKSTIVNKEKTEERLRLLSRAVEHSPVSIVVTNHEGIIEYVNPKFTGITGYTRTEAIGNNPRILNSGYHPQSFYKELWDTIISGKDWFGEMRNKRKNGEFCWERVLISPMTDETGKITHFVGVKEDITEKKLMLENLIAAKEAAEESDRLKTAFLHNISHEIRTPLNAIVGFSTFMVDPGLPSEKRQAYHDIIVSGNAQLLSIIDGIMKVSHLQTGQVIINEAEANIRKMTGTLFTQFQPVAAARRLGFTLDNGNIGEKEMILTDEGKLKQILSNLLDNAFKFTNEGYVELGCRKTDGFIEFHIKDTGIGIPEQEHMKIFERFYQVDKSNSQVYGGTGLGLSICAGYSALLGGTLSVKSEPESGSVFTLTIPFRKSKERRRDAKYV